MSRQRSHPAGTPPRLAPPTGHLHVRLRVGPSLLLHRRSLLVGVTIAVLSLGLAIIGVTTGSYALTPTGAVQALLGGGSDIDRFIVREQRLPRAVAAALAGAMLAAAGALFQAVSRNPLGSPDIIGFTTGAATGGLGVILLSGAPTSLSVGLGTLAGGLATATLVVVVSARRGVRAEHLVLGGIAISAALAAINDYLLTRASIESAEAAKAWQFGSLNALTWPPVLVLAGVALVALPAAALQRRDLRVMELGDETAAGLGAQVGRIRIRALGIGVVLTASTVAAAGPIGFVALAAPHIARRLSRAPAGAIGSSMCVGTALLLLSDLAAQRLLDPFQIPVGLLTAAIGGAYLVWLVTRR